METPKKPEITSIEYWPKLMKQTTDLVSGFLEISGMDKSSKIRSEKERVLLKQLYHLVSNPRFNEVFIRKDIPIELRQNLDAMHRLQANYFKDTLPEAEIIPDTEITGPEKDWLAFDPATGEIAKEVEAAERHGEEKREAAGMEMIEPEHVTPEDNNS